MYQQLLQIGLGVGAILGGYASFVEPNLLIQRKERIKLSGYAIPKNYKIVHLTDLHLGRFTTKGRITRLVDTIQKIAPDLLFFTGDMFDDGRHFGVDLPWMITALSQLSAPLGKYAVAGNHEHRHHYLKQYNDFMRKIGFQVLYNQQVTLVGTPLTIVGIDDMTEGKGDISLAFQGFPPSSYGIALCHEPDVADTLSQQGARLILSGHSHGGQVRFPLLGAILLPSMAKRYPQGFYPIGERCFLHTSEGLGMTRLPLRFLSPPNLGVICLDFS